MKYDIAYNNQKDNVNFNGKFSGYAQCFSTSVWTAMSFFSLEIDATNDLTLSKYVDDVEASVGNIPGLAEIIIKQNHSITGRTSLFWDVQRIGMTMWLNNLGVKGKAVVELNAPYTRIKEVLDMATPIVIGTDKMGNLPGGHIVLSVGKTDVQTIVHDPFGNPTTNYTNANGKYIYLMDSYLSKYFSNKILYWKTN
jgi:hypothetical protein